MSGNALTSWSLGNNHRYTAYFMAKLLRCHTEAGDEEAAHCTREDVKDRIEDDDDDIEDDDEETDVYNMCLVDQMSSEKIMHCLRKAPLEFLVEAAVWLVVS